jgi:hypothetical protein
MHVGSISGVFWGIIAILLGTLFLFFGVKIFKLAVGLAGFGAFSAGAYILVGQVYGSLGVPQDGKSDVVRYGASLLAGVLGGFVSIWLWKVALVSLGVLGGLGLGIWALSWRSNGLISNPTHRTVFLSVLAAAGGLASIFFETPLIIASTAVVGSIVLSAGIDSFVHAGFNEAFRELVQNKGATFTIGKAGYGLLAWCGAAVAMGAFFQFILVRQKGKSV